MQRIIRPQGRRERYHDADSDCNANTYTHTHAESNADADADCNADANTFTRARHLPAESSHQNALISRLRIPSCRLITEEELFRITAMDMGGHVKELWAGDLDGLYNMERLVLKLHGPLPPDLLADLGKLIQLSVSFRATEKPWEVADYFPTLPNLVELTLDARMSPLEAEWEGMVVGESSFAGMPSLTTMALAGVREVEDGAFLGLSELTNLTLHALSTKYYVPQASMDERPLLPPRLFKPLSELESLRAEGFRWPYEQGMEVTYVQMCRGLFSRIGGAAIRFKVDGQPAGVIANDAVGGGRVCRVGVGPQWPENGDPK